MRGVFVTGTDTGVGKTVVAAALVHTLRSQGEVGYWKPVQTGIEQDDDTATVRGLAACADEEIWDRGVRLERPVSPHLAARLAGVSVDVAGLLRAAPPEDRLWVVEGAGGVLVPLNERECVVDLIGALALPVVVAARSGLGTINHTLLTIEALRARACPVAGVVLVGPRNPENREAIADRARVPVLGELPWLPVLTAEALGAWTRGAGLDATRCWRP